MLAVWLCWSGTSQSSADSVMGRGGEGGTVAHPPTMGGSHSQNKKGQKPPHTPRKDRRSTAVPDKVNTTGANWSWSLARPAQASLDCDLIQQGPIGVLHACRDTERGF
ncbi:hypothetical protein AAFF_G00252340 [Aldrovandia affinis]|uniref:Secreted protein n=1 Tax=Aldrovandia affinis TaxID=143900 RepID=A0AAD7WUC4_9TELE|nr:hypothetical protein AAFF_G00252340 [Aldrovandia affinis]